MGSLQCLQVCVSVQAWEYNTWHVGQTSRALKRSTNTPGRIELDFYCNNWYNCLVSCVITGWEPSAPPPSSRVSPLHPSFSFACLSKWRIINFSVWIWNQWKLFNRNVLPPELFQKLFRQDLLVASLFRNFLLAERIMRSSNCTPISYPKLPPTYNHPMWLAWDLAADSCLSQLPGLLQRPAAEYKVIHCGWS